ncbi:MAG: SCO family protein [Anaerolineales bacterium]|nr:SCO family protein [Anaerolineales bacterium]
MKSNRFWFYLSLSLLFATFIWFIVLQRSNQQTYQGVEFNEPATDFQLNDQQGNSIRLSDFHGKIVILTFMDTQCVDTCPITAHHFIQTYQQLSETQKEQVIFLGVNVNAEAATIENINTMTTAWGLDQIPQWYFLTGDIELLEPVWKAYNVSVTPRTTDHQTTHTQLVHTPGTYIIDSIGQIRWYVSTPYNTSDSEWIPPLYEILIKHIKTLSQES